MNFNCPNRQLPTVLAYAMLQTCLGAQAGRTSIRLQRELSPPRPANLRQGFIVRNGRILPQSPLVNWAAAKAEKNALGGSLRNGDETLPEKRQIRDGRVTRSRSRNGLMPFADSAFIKVSKE